jgi:uncharacterized protein (DUF58 family)
MTPTLALRGRLVATCAALFLGAGGLYRGAWPLVFLGFAAAAALCVAYLAFYPTAIFLRRHKVELAWWVPPGDQPGGALTAGIPFTLHVALRNRGLRPLRVASAQVFASSAIVVPPPLATFVRPGEEVEVTASLRATACGHWVLHGALIKLGDVLGLFEVRAYFPSPIGLKVFPKLAAPRAGQAVMRPEIGALHERTGVHVVRRRGLMGDLREIREHAHGDPFKMIAWKATARRRQLMVRELESEIVVTHQLLVDMAATMRAGPLGASKLDYAIETAAALARAALEGGDRVGLTTFDTRVHEHLKAGEGRPHFLRVLDKLIETRNVVDADLTELTDGELVAATARYLLHQEGVDFRLSRPPPRDDPAWARVAAGPAGELYDLAALAEHTLRLLRASQGLPRAGQPHETHDEGRAPTSGFWSRMNLDPRNASDTEKLRAFCKLRGIELPYRSSVEPGRRAAGLVEALHRAGAAERSQLVVLISDLEAVLDDTAACLAAIGLLARRHHRLLVVAPTGADFLPATRTDAGDRVAQVLAWEERRRLDEARRELGRRGVQVLAAGAGDGAELLVRRFLRARPLRA